MKFCEICNTEIATPDGENRCAACENAETNSKEKRSRRNRQRRERHEILISLGLRRVRGALGGVYYE